MRVMSIGGVVSELPIVVKGRSINVMGMKVRVQHNRELGLLMERATWRAIGRETRVGFR
jgi:hypothetical protein